MMIEPSRTIYREGLNFGLINSESGAFPKSLYTILFKVSNLDAKGLAKLAASSAYSKHLIRSADFGRTCCKTLFSRKFNVDDGQDGCIGESGSPGRRLRAYLMFFPSCPLVKTLDDVVLIMEEIQSHHFLLKPSAEIEDLQDERLTNGVECLGNVKLDEKGRLFFLV